MPTGAVPGLEKGHVNVFPSLGSVLGINADYRGAAHRGPTANALQRRLDGVFQTFGGIRGEKVRIVIRKGRAGF